MYSLGSYDTHNMHKRSYLDVDTYFESVSVDPIIDFVHSLRIKYGGSDIIEKQNAQLLDRLIYNNYISKSSIIWTPDNIISRIYGININSDGSIRYDNPKLHSPEKKRPHVVMPNTPELDLSAIQSSLHRFVTVQGRSNNSMEKVNLGK